MPSSVRPTNTPRVTMLMQSSLLMNGIRSTSVDLLTAQNQLTTGLRIGRPSDSPALASSIMHLDSALEKQSQYLKNIQQAGSTLGFSDAAMSEVVSGMRSAHETSLEAIGKELSERIGKAEYIDGIIDGIITAANSQDEDGYYIFGGQKGTGPPFVRSATGGVLFTGDFNSLRTRVSSDISFDFSISAQDAFNLVGNQIPAAVDLNPAMTADTLLSDLNGGMDQGIRLGGILVADGTGAVNVDLSNCITVGDVINKIENCGLASIQGVVIESGVGGTNLRINVAPAETITVSEVGSGYTARDLGINGSGNPLIGQDVDARLSAATPVAALAPGVGIDTISGLTITNSMMGTENIDISAATTLGDIIKSINDTDLAAHAQINAAGTGIEVYNLLSGSELTIGENGGATAADLGIRSMTGDTRLADLNGGNGVHLQDGSNDITITDCAGGVHDINLDGCETITDVIAAINAVTGVAVVASLATNGNGIVLTDGTAGLGDLTVTNHTDNNESGYFTAQELGLTGPDAESTATVINGADVNPVTVDSVFSNLLTLKDALKINNTDDADQQLTSIGDHLEDVLDTVINIYGRVGVQMSTLEDRKTYMEDKLLATESLRSDIADIDFTEAITRYQNLYTALQGSLISGGQLNNTSLLDFLQ